MYTIDHETTMPIVHRAPRYAMTGENEIASPPVRRTVGRPFPRTQNSVELVPVGLLEDAIDPRTEDPDAEMAYLTAHDYAAIYAEVIPAPVNDAQIEVRLALLEAHVKPGITLAQVLTGADLLGVGKHYDLAHWLAVNTPEPAGLDLSIVTDRWGYRFDEV